MQLEAAEPADILSGGLSFAKVEVEPSGARQPAEGSPKDRAGGREQRSARLRDSFLAASLRMTPSHEVVQQPPCLFKERAGLCKLRVPPPI